MIHLSESLLENDPVKIDLIPTPRKNADIARLTEFTKKMNSRTLALQKESTDMSDCRFLCDEILVEYPEINRYISAIASICHSRFSNAPSQKSSGKRTRK